MGSKKGKKFRHWTLFWTSLDQLTTSQTIFSRSISALTARIWMRLLLKHGSNFISLVLTEQYCVMSNSCKDFCYIISPATLHLTILETCIMYVLRLVSCRCSTILSALIQALPWLHVTILRNWKYCSYKHWITMEIKSTSYSVLEKGIIYIKCSTHQ